jgi:hypothetical protein
MCKTAYQELLDFLEEDEKIEKIVFGIQVGYEDNSEENPPFGKLMSLRAARKYMQHWDFSDNPFSLYAWTNRRVIFVTEYDGYGSLAAVPKNPERGTVVYV